MADHGIDAAPASQNDQKPKGPIRRKLYSPGEEIANSVSHGVGVLLSIAALVLLIVMAVSHGGGVRLAAALLMGISLIIGTVLGGIAVIENAYDETYLIKGLTADEIVTEEPKLRDLSYETIAHLLFDKCDVLVVDKIGKNISGDGMDPNVSGRFVQPKYCSGGIEAEKVVILDLTDETHGNAQGVGLAEVTTRRLFNKMKLEMTYPTGVTNTFLHLMKIPMIMDNDREALQLALCCCPDAEDHEHLKMIRIPNTAHIEYIEISEGLLPQAEANPNIEILSEPYDLAFDAEGNLF